MKSLLKRSPLFAFNLVFRDRWVAAQAATLPAGARVLDIGAGSCPYRSLFAHCDYRTQDFTGLQDDQLRHGGYGRIDYVCDAADIPPRRLASMPCCVPKSWSIWSIRSGASKSSHACSVRGDGSC